jgi:hypothetical protein
MTDRELMDKAWDYLASYTAGERPNASEVNDLVFALERRLAQPEQEPVAWMYTSQYKGNESYITRYQTDLTTYKAVDVWPLYTTPPQQEKNT